MPAIHNNLHLSDLASALLDLLRAESEVHSTGSDKKSTRTWRVHHSKDDEIYYNVTWFSLVSKFQYESLQVTWGNS